MSREIIKEFAELQKIRENQLMEIGLLFANNYHLIDDKSLIPGITNKILVLEKIEEQLNELESEVITMGTA